MVEDYAGNRDFASLADFAGTEDSGRIKVSVLDADTHKELDTDLSTVSRMIKDSMST